MCLVSRRFRIPPGQCVLAAAETWLSCTTPKTVLLRHHCSTLFLPQNSFSSRTVRYVRQADSDPRYLLFFVIICRQWCSMLQPFWGGFVANFVSCLRLWGWFFLANGTRLWGWFFLATSARIFFANCFHSASLGFTFILPTSS